jgi:O-antigen ligase
MTILRDRYPDRYVVRHIRENHPDAYEAGSVYDVHNAYLGAFVMTGMLGFLAVVVFLALCAKRVLQHILVQRQRSYGQLALFALVIVILVSAFFDNDLFFWCTNSSVTFWLLAGILLETTEMPAEKGN